MGSFAMNDLQMSAMAGADVPPLALALACCGFLIKLGAVPLHVWLPLAHAAAPAPASAVLSGAMLKAGLFGLILVLPLGQTALPGFALAFAVMAVAGLVLALVLGLVQGDPKAVLAYSSIGQMSLILLGLAAALAAPDAWVLIAPALVLLALNHAFAKAALFLGVPVVWSTKRGGLRIAVLALMALPALSLTGVPGTNGGLAKSALKTALEGAPDSWALWLGTAFFIASFGTGVLMIRAVVLLADAPHKPEIARDVALPWSIMSGLVVFGLALAGVAGGGADAAPLADYYPLASALLAALLVVFVFQRSRLRLTPVTPGELLGLFVQDESAAQDPVAPVAGKSGTAIGVTRGKRSKLRPERGALAILCIAATLVLITALSPTTPVAPPPAAPEAVE